MNAAFEQALYNLASDGIEVLREISVELGRIHARLSDGRLNVRSHHPLCQVPLDLDPTVEQLEAVSKYVSAGIASGALVLPQKAGGRL